MVSRLASFCYQKKYIDYNSSLINNLPARYNYSETNEKEVLKKSALDIALGRIARYDTENVFGKRDKKMSFDEYLTEQRHNLKATTGNSSISDQEKLILKEDFNSLDINSDGFLDNNELANEILAMDSLGNKDGIITEDEFSALWDGEKNSPEKIKQLLTECFAKYFAKNVNIK